MPTSNDNKSYDFSMTVSQQSPDLIDNTANANRIELNIDPKSISSLNSNLHLSTASNSIEIEGHINKAALIEELKSSCSDHKNSQATFTFEIGIDEVGRGPLYGSVVVAAVILPSRWSDDIAKNPLSNSPLTNLTDSKKISAKKRDKLVPLIKSLALGYVTVEVPASIIDAINIYQATMLGMRLAGETLVCAVTKQVEVISQQSKPNQKNAVSGDQSLPNHTNMSDFNTRFRLLIDGNALPNFEWQNMLLHRLNSSLDDISVDPQQISAEAWIKGDGRHTAIAAASVLAKVSRDNQLIAASKLYPDYQLDKHKGYPTKAHLLALEKYGVLPEHRRSFKPVQRVINKTIE